MKKSVGFSLTADVVETIDRLVVERRRRNPAVIFTRSDFLKEATLRAVQEASQPRVRERVRATAA